MWKANKFSYFQEQWTHSECYVSLQKFPNRENLNPIRLRSLPRWELSAWLKNQVQNPQWRPQTSTSHTKTHRETDENTQSTERFSLQCTELSFTGGWVSENWELSGGLILLLAWGLLQLHQWCTTGRGTDSFSFITCLHCQSPPRFFTWVFPHYTFYSTTFVWQL